MSVVRRLSAVTQFLLRPRYAFSQSQREESLALVVSGNIYLYHPLKVQGTSQEGGQEECKSQRMRRYELKRRLPKLCELTAAAALCVRSVRAVQDWGLSTCQHRCRRAHQTPPFPGELWAINPLLKEGMPFSSVV